MSQHSEPSRSPLLWKTTIGIAVIALLYFLYQTSIRKPNDSERRLVAASLQEISHIQSVTQNGNFILFQEKPIEGLSGKGQSHWMRVNKYRKYRREIEAGDSKR